MADKRGTITLEIFTCDTSALCDEVNTALRREGRPATARANCQYVTLSMPSEEEARETRMALNKHKLVHALGGIVLSVHKS